MTSSIDRRHNQKSRFTPISILVVLLSVLLGIPTGADGVAILMLAFTFSFLCLRLMITNRSGEGIGPDLVVLGLLGVGCSLSALYLVVVAEMNTLGVLPVMAVDVPRLAFEALALFWLTALGFALGYYVVARWSKNPFVERNMRSGIFPWPRGLWTFTIMALTIVGVLATVVFVASNSGVIAILGTWNNRDSLEGGIPRLLMYAMPLASLLWLSGKPKRWWLVLIHLGVSFVFLSLTGSRNEGVRLVAAAFVLAWNDERWREFVFRKRRLLALWGLIAFLVFFSVGGAMRSAARSFDPLTREYLVQVVSRIGNFETLEQFVYAYLPSIQLVAQSLWLTPSIIPFQEGATFVSALDVWIPGPFMFGSSYIKIGKEVYWAIMNTTWDSALFVSYPGELYLNWGVMGVILGSTFLGVVCGFIFRAWQRFRGNPWADTLYAVFVGLFLPFFLMVEALHASLYSYMYFYLLIPSLGLLVCHNALRNATGYRRSVSMSLHDIRRSH